MEFVERFKYPIIVSCFFTQYYRKENLYSTLLSLFLSLSLSQVQYDTDELLESTFLGSGLHLAVVFPGLSGASDIEPVPLVMGVAQKAFLNYAFVLADRSANYLT